MSRDDDPEARIADLERSPSQPARTGPSQPATSAGNRLGWLILGLLIAILVVSGGLILADRGGRPVSGRPTIGSTTPPSAPSTTVPSTTAPSSIAPPGSATSSPTPAPSTPPERGGRTSVSGVETRQTIACANGVAEVSISGVKNTVVVTGQCGRVEVSGIENQVTIEQSDAIEVSGLNNSVRFRSGTPELTKSGIGNTVERG